MSVHTTYDDMRDILREKLTECLEIARDMLDEKTWGYDHMEEDYAIDIYQAVKKTKDMV